MNDPEITNPLASRLHEKKDAEDAQTGKGLLEKDFISKGKAAARHTDVTVFPTVQRVSVESCGVIVMLGM